MRSLGAFVSLFVLTTGPVAGQAITWSVSFNDPGAVYSSYYGPIQSHLQAAGARWGQFMQPATNVTVAVQVSFDTSIAQSTGFSQTSNFIGVQGGLNVYEQGVCTLIRTGTDTNGATPDMLFRINPSYMQNTLWFDPNPTLRTATPDPNRIDAMSVMLHEVGHTLGFNGWRNGTNGGLPSNFQSTFDRHVTFDGQNLFFNGPNAVNIYGGAVPLTYDNPFHVGNSSPRPGQDLIPDLMNGVVFTNGTRYDVSLLDRAILLDSNLPMTPVPEPTGMIAFGALTGAIGWGWRRLRRAKAPKFNPIEIPVGSA